ncbi:MAG: DUF2344 domain-containing protein [Actinomycetota bacterium]|nr:MAG: DUF2344 domain-containing protein [Actinomycetota bacterium]
MQRLRFRYAKRGRLRFSSHRDFQRALERAIRRAGVPVAFSAGFSPHPKISYAGAAPTGVASEAEYVEVAVVERCDPALVRAALDEALPAGLDVIEVVEALTPDLPQRLEASVWRIALPGVTPREADAACHALLGAAAIEVERVTKAGVRRFDARAAVLSLVVLPPDTLPPDTDGVRADPQQPCAILEAVVRHVTPSVRPDDVLTALRSVADLAPPEPPRVIRLAQGPLVAGDTSVGDPLAPDREAAVGV